MDLVLRRHGRGRLCHIALRWVDGMHGGGGGGTSLWPPVSRRQYVAATLSPSPPHPDPPPPAGAKGGALTLYGLQLALNFAWT